MDELKNKVEGLGKELALFQQRYFTERANLQKQIDETNRILNATKTLAESLPQRISELEKRNRGLAEDLIDLKVEKDAPINTAEVAPKRFNIIDWFLRK